MKEFNQYQNFVADMKHYPKKFSVLYPSLGLCGEAGEIAEKVKKWVRDEPGMNIGPESGCVFMESQRREALLLELGDPLWYIAALAGDLGYTLQEVVEANVNKLVSRKERGVLKGSGDNR